MTYLLGIEYFTCFFWSWKNICVLKLQVVYSFSGQWMYFELIDTMAEPQDFPVEMLETEVPPAMDF